MPTLTMDNRSVTVASGTTLLEAARCAGIHIPTLCAHDGVEPWGGCRLCVVDISRSTWDGPPKMVVSCLYAAEDGLIVDTNSPRVVTTRRVLLDLLLARCPDTPLVQQLARDHGIERTSYERNPEPTDCILCGLCTRACDAMGVSAIGTAYRGTDREVVSPFEQPPQDCIGCLACAEICPTHCIPHEVSRSQRTIWGRTFDMLACSACGRAFVTQAQATREADRHGVPLAFFETCDACKRRALAEMADRLRPA